jgi:hypothetical protein
MASMSSSLGMATILLLRAALRVVGLVRHLDLPHHQTLAGGEGRDHVDGILVYSLRATNRLAVDGDDALRNADQRGHPGNKAALEVIGIQGGEDIAQMIMRRRAFAERTEPAQQSQLLLAEAGDVGDGFRPGDHRQQTQQKHLRERVFHLRQLPTIGQIFEIAQKNNRLGDRRRIASRSIHPGHPRAKQRTSTDSAILAGVIR